MSTAYVEKKFLSKEKQQEKLSDHEALSLLKLMETLQPLELLTQVEKMYDVFRLPP